MKIFSFFSQQQQNPEWTYTAHGGIWRILFSSGRIVGECRNHELKRATFFCLDERTGIVVWQDKELNEPWWIGIDAVHRSFIVLHQFANPSLPEHKGIIVLELESGKELWRNDELTFWFAYGDRLYAYKTEYERRRGYTIRMTDGVIESEYVEALDDLFALRQLAMNEEPTDEFVFPEVVDEQALASNEAAIVSSETRQRAIRGDIEIIRQAPFLLLNYFVASKTSTAESPALENHFSIYNAELGKKLFSDVLATDAKAPTPDSFFIKGQLVYCIKNQGTLTALRLRTGVSES